MFLTEREALVFARIAAGQRPLQIARQLGITCAEVHLLRDQCVEAFGARTLAEAVRVSFQWGSLRVSGHREAGRGSIRSSFAAVPCARKHAGGKDANADPGVFKLEAPNHGLSLVIQFDRKPGRLTKLETEVALGIIEKGSFKEVAQEFHRKADWASHTVHRAMRKVGATTLADLIPRLIYLGYLKIDSYPMARPEAMMRSIVRLQDRDGAVAGAGFLVCDHLICTCAHVVTESLGLWRGERPRKEQRVHVAFYPFQRATGTGVVEVWEPRLDIAVLRLAAEAPAGADPAKLVARGGVAFAAYGFPDGHDQGVWARGQLGEALADGRQQLYVAPGGYPIVEGFSGTAVWAVDRGGAVGMIGAREQDESVKVAFSIPTNLLANLLAEVHPLCVR